MNTSFFSWLFLAVSILFEVGGTLSLKYSNGFTNVLPASSAVICFVISIWLMSISLKQLEMSSCYAVWAAASTAIVALLGMIFYAESMSSPKIIGITFVIIGVVLVNVNS